MQCYKVTQATIFKVAGLVKSECEELEIRGIDVGDCGIYAIANAYELCRSKDPSEIEWCVDEMRGHWGNNKFPNEAMCTYTRPHASQPCAVALYLQASREEGRRWCSAVPVIGGFTKNV